MMVFVDNIRRIPGGSITVVHSPDDGFYYLERFDLKTEKTRVSEKNFSTRAEAIRAIDAGKIKWEKP